MDKGDGWRVELMLTRETLRVERLAAEGGEQVTIEGEATLPGSMRDAVTVLSVQAQAYITSVQAGNNEAAVRGRVCFQVLYTQGDLTRVRALESGCDFTHTVPLPGSAPGMRMCAIAVVQETEGVATSGRITLRALLNLSLEAVEAVERDVITEAKAREREDQDALRTRMQKIPFCVCDRLGEGRTLVREEFDLPQRLGVGEVLSATATASAGDFSGGNGRIGVSGVIEVRVLHRAKAQGEPLVTTVHEMPYEMSIDAQLMDGAQMQAEAEVIDVMADSVESDKGRTLRVEAEVRVTLHACRQQEIELLGDLYSLSGPALEAKTEELEVQAAQTYSESRESVRLQVTLPSGAAPIGTMVAAFVQPTLISAVPSGRRLDAEGIMCITMIYLPVDSDVPCSVKVREPFAMTFPIEIQKGVKAHVYTIETIMGPTTSDRAELRCVLGMRAVQHDMCRIRFVREIEEVEQEKQPHGFVLVWPEAGETRWETARRLRVPQESLRAAGKNALLAFRKSGI